MVSIVHKYPYLDDVRLQARSCWITVQQMDAYSERPTSPRVEEEARFQNT
jgi:hypothetical protein